MYNFEEYRGTVINELDFDYGQKFVEINDSFDSGSLNEYIYKNSKGDFFYVRGVRSHPLDFGNNIPKEQLYHLALVCPIESEALLKKYLAGAIPGKEMFNSNHNVYILKLDAPIYQFEWSGKLETAYTMHPVKDNKEVTRQTEQELKDFNLLEAKKIPMRDLPEFMNPKNFSGRFQLRKKLNFIFISDSEKKTIIDYIKS